jgi:hypothetical protein
MLIRLGALKPCLNSGQIRILYGQLSTSCSRTCHHSPPLNERNIFRCCEVPPDDQRRRVCTADSIFVCCSRAYDKFFTLKCLKLFKQANLRLSVTRRAESICYLSDLNHDAFCQVADNNIRFSIRFSIRSVSRMIPRTGFIPQ